MVASKHIVLVTGAGGFLGGAVCRALAKNWSVRGAFRQRPSQSESVLVDWILGELSDDFNWSDALNGVSVVIHCAARVHVLKEYADDPIREFRAVNVDGTINLARQAARCGVRRFIYISSIGVNGGETIGRPFLPSDTPAPHTAYAVSKCEAECELKSLAKDTGLEVVILRPPLIYGPEAPGNFASLMKVLKLGLPLPLASVSDNRRSFVYIDNVVDLIVRCLEHPSAANQTFLVSDGENISTASFLLRLGEALGWPARLFPVPLALLQIGARLIGRPDLAQRLFASLEIDIRKTEKILDWEPPVSIDEGLRRTAAHWLSTRDGR